MLSRWTRLRTSHLGLWCMGSVESVFQVGPLLSCVNHCYLSYEPVWLGPEEQGCEKEPVWQQLGTAYPLLTSWAGPCRAEWQQASQTAVQDWAQGTQLQARWVEETLWESLEVQPQATWHRCCWNGNTKSKSLSQSEGSQLLQKKGAWYSVN